MAQGFFSIKGFFAQSLLTINLIISIRYMVYAINRYKFPIYMQVLSWLLVMLTIYGVLLILGHERFIVDLGSKMRVDNSSYLKNILNSLLPIFPFYVFARRGLLTENSMRRWLVFFFVVTTCSFFQVQQDYLYLAREKGLDVEEFTNNVGYVFVSLLPMTVFLRKKPFLMYLAFSYCMLFIIMGMKRGAIIIGTITVVVALFRLSGGFSRFVNKKFFLFSCAILLTGYLVVSYYMENSEYFNYRLEQSLEGDSSNRDMLYSVLYRYYISHTDSWQFLFGMGGLGTLKVAHQYAHNDWLELAINQGILGVMMYLAYWIAAYKEWKKSDKSRIYSLVMLLLLLDYFIRSFISMSYNNMNFITTMTLGYCLAQNQMMDIMNQRRIEKWFISKLNQCNNRNRNAANKELHTTSEATVHSST